MHRIERSGHSSDECFSRRENISIEKCIHPVPKPRRGFILSDCNSRISAIGLMDILGLNHRYARQIFAITMGGRAFGGYAFDNQQRRAFVLRPTKMNNPRLSSSERVTSGLLQLFRKIHGLFCPFFFCDSISFQLSRMSVLNHLCAGKDIYFDATILSASGSGIV